MAPQEPLAEAPSIVLGFIEDQRDAATGEQPDAFTSKVGGLPLFFPGRRPLNVDRVLCGECEKPMPLLVQMYAPFDDDSSRYAYHRTVYVFACRDGRCHRAAGTRRASQPPACVRVFRTQASETQIDEGEATAREDVATHASRSICVVCGLYGDKTCAECRNVCYCSKEHQKMHWTAGHKLACASASASAAQLQSTTSAISYGFPESLIDSADDDFEVRKLEELGETSMALVPARLDAPAPAAPWIGEEYEDDATCVDKAFLRFQKRIRFHPDQVLRYATRNTSTDEEEDAAAAACTNDAILWASDTNQPSTNTDIPPCSRCNTPRTFEFQIMPQLLNHLALNHADPDCMDFGTLLVYSCPRSCCGDTSDAYAEEVCWRQDFTQDGMGNVGKTVEAEECENEEDECSD